MKIKLILSVLALTATVTFSNTVSAQYSLSNLSATDDLIATVYWSNNGCTVQGNSGWMALPRSGVLNLGPAPAGTSYVAYQVQSGCSGGPVGIESLANTCYGFGVSPGGFPGCGGVTRTPIFYNFNFGWVF